MGEIISPAQIMDLTLLSPRYEQIKA